jgi:predicted XRE-type DNA-binding protein
VSDPITIEESSGNVFADLGLPDAEQRLAKADLSIQIGREIRARGLTQAEAAKLLGMAQPDVSNLLRGQLSGFSMDRLLRFLNALDQDVEIVVRPATQARAGLRVVA